MSGAITAGTIAAVAGIGAAGSVATGIIGSNAAGNAASAQAHAANNAANLQYQASQNALGFQEQQYNQEQANAAPWLQSGAAGLSNLDYLLGIAPPTTQGTMTGAPASYSAQSPPMTRSSPSGVNQPGMPTSGMRSSAVPTGLSLPAAGTVPGTPGTPGSGLATLPGPTGTTNLASTVNPKLGGFGSLSAPYSGSFTAPTGLTEQNDPGYQARLQLGTQAIQQSAAARGDVVTGGTANDLNQYAQNYASNEYNNVYNRALTNYTTQYNQYNQQQAKQYNQLAALAGVGQQTAQQLGNAGQNVANAVSNNVLGTAQNMGADYQNAGAANASGYVGGANAINGAISGGTSNLSNLMLLSAMSGAGNPYQTLANAQGAQNSAGGQALNPTISSYGGLL